MKSASITAIAAFAVGLLGAGAAAAAACEGQPSQTRLVVKVEGVSAAKGEMAVTVYPDEARRFLAPKGKLARVRIAARAPVTTACFWLPQPGAYAVAVYHDANADHDFNRTLIGLPAEGFGFSNDPPTPTGLPPFRSVRFEAPAGETVVRVNLRYLK